MTITRGFAKTKEQAQALKAHGLPDKAIYLDGRGAETLEACLETFRDRPGVLVIAHDLRLVGTTKRAVTDFMARMELAGIRVQDISNPDDKTVAQLIQRASVAISATRYHGDRPRARRHGREGGKANGRTAWMARGELAPKWVIDRIVDHPGLTWPTKLEILGPEFSESTLRRHYGLRNGRRA